MPLLLLLAAGPIPQEQGPVDPNIVGVVEKSEVSKRVVLGWVAPARRWYFLLPQLVEADQKDKKLLLAVGRNLVNELLLASKRHLDSTTGRKV